MLTHKNIHIVLHNFSPYISNFPHYYLSTKSTSTSKRLFPHIKDKYDVYTIHGYKIPLETSKIKNTFGINTINTISSLTNILKEIKSSKTSFFIKAYLTSIITIYIYKKHIRPYLMKHHSDLYDNISLTEQKIMKSPFVQIFTKNTFHELLCDSLIIYFLGQSTYISSISTYNKLIYSNVFASTLACFLNNYMNNIIKSKQINIKNFFPFDKHCDTFPNMFLTHFLFNLSDTFIKSPNLFTKALITYSGYTLIGKPLRFISNFASPNVNILSSKGVYSSLIYALLFKDKLKLIPLWIPFHLINPVSLWSFIKTKNSFYKDELDNIYGKHNLLMKAFIYCKYNCLNTFAYMTKL